MKTRFENASAWLRRSLASGYRSAFGVLLAFGFVILAFLFVTVHNRRVAAYETERADEWGRYRSLIVMWIEKGPLAYGDFRLAAPFEKKWTDTWGPMDPSRDYLYQSYPMTFLRPAYLVELLHHLLRGRYSQTLMVIHNQALVWLSSALLGLLAFAVARDRGMAAPAAILLGFSCQAVYQTFPYNLRFYWEAYYTTTMSVMVAWYLLLLYRLLRNGPDTPRRLTLALTTFLLFYVDYVGATFMMPSVVLVLALLDRPALKRLAPVSTVLLPGILFYGLFAAERHVVLQLHPELAAVGSTFLARTGLDGSAVYFTGHMDLLRSPRRDLLAMWGWLFVPGVLGFVALALMSLSRRQLRQEVILLSAALGLYLPKAFAFSQETAIHPYAYDVYLVIPVILGLLGFLPAWLEKRFEQPGLFVLAAVAAAFCYSFIQLRLYAVTFPIPPEVRWLRL